MNAEKRLKQGGHTLHQPRGVAITCNFFFRYAYMSFLVLTKKIQAQKRYNYIYHIHVLKYIHIIYMFLKTGVYICMYIYLYIYAI